MTGLISLKCHQMSQRALGWGREFRKEAAQGAGDSRKAVAGA